MRTLTLMLLSFALMQPTSAQTNTGLPTFNPSHWVPLDVGNQWHYTYTHEGVAYESVEQVVGDTLVGSQRWARIQTVWSSTGQPFSSKAVGWFTYTPDQHVVSVRERPRGSLAQMTLDTFYVARPQSVFLTHTTRAQTMKMCGGVSRAVRVTTTDDPAIQAYVRDRGSVVDSTVFALVVGTGGSGGEAACQGTFVYRVGPANGLVGAIVGGRRWGDVRLLESLDRETVEVDREAFVDSGLRVYPSPASNRVQVRLDGPAGRVAIYNALGQRMAEVEAGAGEAVTVPLDWPAGVYFARVDGSGAVQTFVVQPR